MEARLRKLEHSLQERHRQSWNRFEAAYRLHLTSVQYVWSDFLGSLVETLEGNLNATLEELWPPLEGFDRSPLLSFFTRVQELQDAAAEGDLSVWPHHLPIPPDEPPGAWERLLGLLDAQDEATFRAAVLSLWSLAYGRACRGITSRIS